MKYNNNNNNISKKKIFTIVDFPKDKECSGRFISSIPKKAADQAFSYLINYMNINKNDEDDLLGKFIVFVIKDIDNNKMYKYIGNRIKLKNPIIKINKDGSKIEYHYKNVIGKYNKELDKI